MRHLLVFLALAVSASAQPLPEGAVFDDFTYASTDWRETILSDGPGATYRPDAPSPEGSLYGPNDWYTPGGTISARAWYRYGWQESTVASFNGTLTPSSRGLLFSIPPGTYRANGCPDPNDPSKTINPQQISTGFSARRGTWAGRVRLGQLPPPNEASMMQAFWLVSPMGSQTRTPNGLVKLWNEVDHEFNNRFLGARQPFEYDATSYRSGNGSEAIHAPMYARALHGESPGNAVPWPDGLGWTCTVIHDGRGSRESPEACAARLANPPARQDPFWATLLLHVSDEAIRFSLHAENGSERVVMASDRMGPPTSLPMTALFSQHFYPPDAYWTCEQWGTARQPVTMDTDWFYYSQDPEASIEDVRAGVEAFRSRQIARGTTIPNVRLSRPDRPLSGVADEWGYGSRTTPLSISFVAPRAMRPGEDTRIVALPPLRHGTYRYTWSTSTRMQNGPLVTERLGEVPFELPFTFPENAQHVIVRVRLEEVNDAGEVVRNEIVRPVEDTLLIRRAR